MDEKRCLLCNRAFNHEYEMFGRECLDNLYDLMGFSKKFRITKNKEMNLCIRIAWRNHKFFLNKNKKYLLTQKYIALNYLNKMNYDSLNDIKVKISKDINSINPFSKNTIETISFKLNDVYKLFNYSQKFNKIIEKCKSIDWEKIDKKLAEEFIKNMSFIFDITKKSSPISYTVFYSMQFIFWKVVIAGGLLTNKPLSAKLLSNSLTLFGKEANDLIIDDKETVDLLTESEEFKEKIKEIVNRYGKETEKFNLGDVEKNGVKLSFKGGDLFYALHDATMFINAEKNGDNTWKLEGEINDTYDFTEFKDIKEYADDDNWLTDMFSTLLNNFGVVSSEFGVLQTYDLKIKFNFSSYEIK